MSIEQFLVAQATPGLLPGERILGCALLRHPRRLNAFGVPQHYEEHLGVATDRRLVVFETEVGGMLSPVPKPVARNPVVWSYDELARLELDTVQGAVVHSGGRGRVLYLAPIPGLGPYAAKNPSDEHEVAMSARRYDVYAEIEGLPGQTQFMDQLLPWMEGQFRAGAFAASPQRRQEIEARLAGVRAQMEAERQRAAAARAAMGPKLVKAAIGGIAGLMVLGGIILAVLGAQVALRYQRTIAGYDKAIAIEEADLAWSRGSAPMPAGCPEQGELLPIPGYTCHGCETYSYPREGWKRVVRGTDSYVCPPASERERSIASHRELRDGYRGDVMVGIGMVIGGLLLVLVGAGGGFFGLRWHARRTQAPAPG